MMEEPQALHPFWRFEDTRTFLDESNGHETRGHFWQRRAGRSILMKLSPVNNAASGRRNRRVVV
jgi:hypothetical protein